jgi:hypothetical protein
MATWRGTNGADNHDFIEEGESNDKGFGRGGNDIIVGWQGHDTLAGQTGDDQLRGELGRDVLLGGKGRDKLWGDEGVDVLWGGLGKDKLRGGDSGDAFYFELRDTGHLTTDRITDQADRIFDFRKNDTIVLEDSYNYSPNNPDPLDGEWSIWQPTNNPGGIWVVTYNSPETSTYHDIVVQGAVPEQSNITFL